MLTIGSLFSGIGGLELGLERAGLGPVLWQVEINPYCRAVLAKHWPEVRRYEDVRLVRGADLAPVDVICGGFPCQDISSAGAKAGIAGPRSGLWQEFRRLVGEAGPRYVVVENVGALHLRGLDVVLGGLADLGMDAIWFPLAAADVGAPHLRERLFVVGYPNCDGPPGVSEHDEAPGLSAVARSPDTEATERRRPSPEAHEGRRDSEVGGLGFSADREEYWGAEPSMDRVAYGVPRALERGGAIGNAVVPQVAEVVGHVVMALATQPPASAGGGA